MQFGEETCIGGCLYANTLQLSCSYKSCFRWVSNPGPLACEASVITTTLRKLTWLRSIQIILSTRLCLITSLVHACIQGIYLGISVCTIFGLHLSTIVIVYSLVSVSPHINGLLCSLCWWIVNVTQNHCIGRESNPGRPRGRRAFYHWTTDAHPHFNF